MKISVVMAYYNRLELLIRTLETIENSRQKSVEVIIVDDGSKAEENPINLLGRFNFVRVISISAKDKWYSNPCIPFNLGIASANGDIVVLQNPECLHVGDVLDYIAENITDENYLSISAYAIPREENAVIARKFLTKGFKDFFSLFPQMSFVDKRGGGKKGWYNHSVFRPVGYHFCAAITRNNLLRLGGFDEKYAEGIAYDDDELVLRIKRMGLKFEIVDSVSVIHQWHDKTSIYPRKEYLDRVERNKRLFDTYTKNSLEINVPNRFLQNEK